MGNSMMLAIDFFQSTWNHICSALYAMFSIIFRLMDWIQSVFRALVGLEPMKINGTMINDGEQKMDVVFHLIQTDIIQDIFWSMITFSLILMFMMTFLAVIRNAYQDKPKPIGNIIGEVFRGLVGMILIPVACFAGLMFGNVILQAVDYGTSFGSASTLSETLFMASAYDANIARDNSDASNDGLLGLTQREKNYKDLLERTNFGEYLNKNGASNYNTTNVAVFEESDWEKIADHIDEAFTMGAITYNSNGEELDLYDPWKVNVCYNMGSFNFIIMLVGGCAMIGFLFKMCFGLITRMFKLLFDFVLIPVVLAMMPFDGGKATGTWKGDFVKNVTLSYGTIGAINLFYSILPVVNDLEFTWGHGGFFTAVLKLVMVIIGLFSAEKLITTVTGWFGVGDLIGEGKSAYDTFKSGLDKVTKQTKNVTGKVAGTFVGGVAGAKQAQKTSGSRFGGFLAGAYGGSGLKAKVDPLLPKGFGDAEKAGKEAYEASRKYGFTKDLKDDRTARYDLEKNKEAYEKRYSPLEKRLAGLTPGSNEYKALDKRIKDMKAKDSNVQAAVEGGYEMTYNTETKTIKEFMEDLEYDKSVLEKNKTTEEVVSAFSENYDDYLQSVKNAKTIGIKPGELKKYLYDGDSTVLQGKTQEELEMINSVKTQFDSSLSSVRKAAKELYKKDNTIFDSNKIVTVPNKAALDTMKPGELMKALSEANMIYNDFGIQNNKNVDANSQNLAKTVENIGAENRAAQKQIDDLQDAIRDTEANAADDLNKNGSKTKDAKLLQAYSKGINSNKK